MTNDASPLPSRRRRTHGHTAKRANGGRFSPTYNSWMAMKARALHGRSKGRKQYYLGISLYPDWMTFEGFLRDMGERPAGTSLDRIDGSKGYEPGNCRWATPKVQGDNRACVDRITFNGKTLNPEEWAAELGLKPQTIRSRISRGWPLEKVLTAPPIRGAGRNPRAKISEAQVREIRRRATGARGEAGRLAEKYGTSRGTIARILKGEAWRYVE